MHGRASVSLGLAICASAFVLAYAPGAQAFGSLSYPVSEQVSRGGSLTGTAELQNASMEDPNLACPGPCGANFPYIVSESIALVEHPAPGAIFLGWGGPCSGNAPTCSFIVSAATTVTATFTPATATPQPVAPGAGGAASGTGGLGQGEEASSVAHLPGRLLGIRALHGHHLEASIVCQQAKPCRLTLAVSSDPPGARLVASRTITLAAGHSAHVSLALNHEGARLLARRRRLPVTARLVLLKAGRQMVVGRGSVTLVA